MNIAKLLLNTLGSAVLLSAMPAPEMQHPSDQECYTCTKAHVQPGPGFGLGGCQNNCIVQNCTGVSTSTVVGGMCTTNVIDKDCIFTGVPQAVLVSQTDRCVVDASITCAEGTVACKIDVTQVTLSVDDCKTQKRTINCVPAGGGG